MSIDFFCRVLGVKRRGYFAWQKRTAEALSDEEDQKFKSPARKRKKASQLVGLAKATTKLSSLPIATHAEGKPLEANSTLSAQGEDSTVCFDVTGSSLVHTDDLPWSVESTLEASVPALTSINTAVAVEQTDAVMPMVEAKAAGECVSSPQKTSPESTETTPSDAQETSVESRAEGTQSGANAFMEAMLAKTLVHSTQKPAGKDEFVFRMHQAPWAITAANLQPQNKWPRLIFSEEFILACAKSICRGLGFTPGWRIIQDLLRHEYGVGVGRRRLKRILRANGIIGFRHYKRRVKTTDSDHGMPVFEDLVKHCFQPGEVNKIWVSDITYLPLPHGKYAYLVTFTDIGSRRILGHAIDTSMSTEFVLRALRTAIAMRGNVDLTGLIVHSDRGSQYASLAYRELLNKHNFRGSMSRRGECHDNAVAEALWSNLKREKLIGRPCFASFEDACQQVEDWILFYNTRRPHSSLDRCCPVEYEQRLKQQAA